MYICLFKLSIYCCFKQTLLYFTDAFLVSHKLIFFAEIFKDVLHKDFRHNETKSTTVSKFVFTTPMPLTNCPSFSVTFDGVVHNFTEIKKGFTSFSDNICDDGQYILLFKTSCE